MYSHDIYFFKTYNLSVYDITYETLCHKHPVIVTAEDKGEYIPTNKDMWLERNSLLTLSVIHPEKSLWTHERFHTEKSLKN